MADAYTIHWEVNLAYDRHPTGRRCMVVLAASRDHAVTQWLADLPKAALDIPGAIKLEAVSRSLNGQRVFDYLAAGYAWD